MLHPDLVIESKGLVPYDEAWQLQKHYHAEIAANQRPPTLLLLEHPRTITLGRSAKPSSLLLTEDDYRQKGFAIHHIERGGDVTYHGPGQLVGYPLIPLVDRVGDYLRQLERFLITLVSHFGVVARPSPGYAGLWVTHPQGHDAKLASIGIAVSKRVAYHGFALNVSTHLPDFDLLIPCGIQGVRMTSLSDLLALPPSIGEVIDTIKKMNRQDASDLEC